jgi:hypothetical protein
VVRRPHDPDAGADSNLVALDLERLVEQRNQLSGERDDVVIVPRLRLDDGKFVAAEPGHQLMAFHARRDALRGLLQQKVADPVAERVVDALEVVEVHAEDRQPLLRVAACRERLGCTLAERGAVRQPGQRVAVGEVVDAGLLVLVLDRDGAQMYAGRYDLAVELARAAGRPVIEREAADDAAVARLDRARPASRETERQRERPVGRP